VIFYKVVLIIICKHLEIYTKTISRLRVGDYKACNHLALDD
jgi:hypothetical protein